MSTQRTAPQIKPYSYKELAAIYQVNEKIFKKWLEPFHAEMGEKIGRLLTPRQVEIIFRKLGWPKGIIAE